MAKEVSNPFFAPIDIAKNLMQTQQGRITKQILGREKQKPRTMMLDRPVDKVIDEIVQEHFHGKR